MAISKMLRSYRLIGGMVAVSAAVITAAAPSAIAASDDTSATDRPYAASWTDGDGDWQHDSYNRFETRLGVTNAGLLHAGLSVSAAGTDHQTMPTAGRDGTLYSGSWTRGDADGHLDAHDGTTGALLWRKPASDGAFPSLMRQPKYLNRRLYVTLSGGETPSSIFDDTAAFDAKTGARLWMVPGVVDVVGHGQVFVRNYQCGSGGCSGFSLTAYDAVTGKLTWQRSLRPHFTFTGGFSGAVLNGSTLYFGENDDTGQAWLRAVDALTGATKWSTAAISTPTAAAIDVATGTVVVSEGTAVSAVDGATGRALWKETGLDVLRGREFWLPGGTSSGAVAVGGGLVYALCGGTNGEELCASRVSDGNTRIATLAPPTCSGTPNFWTGMALANGVLYATSTQCGVEAVDTANMHSLGTVVPGAGLGRPQVGGGRLYAGTKLAFTAWQP